MQRLAALLACLTVVGLALPATGAADEPVALGPSARLERRADQIVDQQGRVVLLHGVNMVWKVAPFVPPSGPGGLDDADLDRIASHGWNAVRLGVIPEGLMPSKGQVDHGYLDAIAATVDRIAAHGLYTLLDVHQDLMGRPWGNGMPDWSIHHTPGLETAEPDLGFPLNAVRPSHNLAWDFFWGDGKVDAADPKGVVGYLADSLGALAARVGDHPGVAGIEFINEPWPGTAFATCAAAYAVGCPLVDQYVQATWQRLTDAIRVTAPDVLVWWEPNAMWNETVPSSIGVPPLTPAVTDPQVAFAFHDYCAFGELSTYLGVPTGLQASCDLYHDLTWANAARHRTTAGLPQLVTEFGNIGDGVELERSLVRSDAAFTGWMYWHFGGGYAPGTERGEPFSAEQLAHLVRTYPRATAGTPGPMAFDPATGELHYTYTPDGGTARTEIAASDVHYPEGYEVVATGARVVSPAGAPVIELAADPGSTMVDVIVRAASRTTPVPSVAPVTLPTTGGASVPTATWLLLGAAAVGLQLARRRPSAADDTVRL